MGTRDYENFKREVNSGKSVTYIKLRDFRILENDSYPRREFREPRNVTINNDNTISFDVENWTTFKSQGVDLYAPGIESFSFEIPGTK